MILIAPNAAPPHKTGMLMLGCIDLPEDNATLHTALVQAISALGADPAGVVLEGTFPSLTAIRLNLTGATFGRESARTGTQSGELREFFSRLVEITATPARFETLPIDLVFRAEDCVLAFGTADDTTRGITMQECSIGAIELAAAAADIEAALHAVAGKAAKGHGAEIRSVHVAFKNDGPRRLTIIATATAKAMFVTATLTIRGHLEIDDEFNARLSSLTITGDGMLANLAAGALRPKLTELEARTFTLARFIPGNISITQLEIEAEPALRLRGAFRCKRDAT